MLSRLLLGMPLVLLNLIRSKRNNIHLNGTRNTITFRHSIKVDRRKLKQIGQEIGLVFLRHLFGWSPDLSNVVGCYLALVFKFRRKDRVCAEETHVGK